MFSQWFYIYIYIYRDGSQGVASLNERWSDDLIGDGSNIDLNVDFTVNGKANILYLLHCSEGETFFPSKIKSFNRILRRE